MSRIEIIKELQMQGRGLGEIANNVGVDRKTAKKYMEKDDFSPHLPEKEEKTSKLDPWKSIINQWLEEDRANHFKQRHTAKRVFMRLRQEYPETFDCCYPLVQRHCKKRKAELGSKRGSLELVWHPGEAQVDFGEAEHLEGENRNKFKYLCVSFPYSNAAYVQAFGGETAECVTQGLKDIFSRIGGVPSCLVFDNACAIGRRLGEKIRLSELFSRFKCHYGFEVRFCNPESGHEKGNVENKVGYFRRNLFVPTPIFSDFIAFNLSLLDICEKDWSREHYKKGKNISELFKVDRQKLLMLPTKLFEPCRYERLKTDGYGKFCLEGKHWYSSKPELSCSELIVRISAHFVEPLDETGQTITRHRRVYGDVRTDRIDYETSIAKLVQNPGAWVNSGIRELATGELQKHIDSLDRMELKATLKYMSELSKSYGLETALQALDEAYKRHALSGENPAVLAKRILSCGLNAISEAGPDLSEYDRVLLQNTKKSSDSNDFGWLGGNELLVSPLPEPSTHFLLNISFTEGNVEGEKR